MELQLFRKSTIRDIKRQFARTFPCLKLEAFSHPHKRFKGSPMLQRLDDNLTLGEIKSFQKEGSLSLNPNTTVADFESLLQDEFGLPVQVFRKAGDVWLETVQTDNLTLAIQNRMGAASRRPIRINLATLFL